jgi:thiosulfate/3-mercaptopyruvate sulfurtransferase
MNRRKNRTYWPLFGSLPFACLFLLGCQPQAETATSEYPNGQLLVNTDWLASRLDETTTNRIIDIRPATDYANAHIPGAVNIPVTEIASTVDDIPLEFDRKEVQNALNAAALEEGMTAVLYDNLGMMNAASMLWTLEYVGHEDVRLLDGGWNAWVDAGLESSSEVPQLGRSNYPIELQDDRIDTAEEVLARLGNPQVTIVDARSPQEYTGEVTYADRGGHIPGAVNLVWLDALTGGGAVYTTESDWREQLQDSDVEIFKSADEISALLQAQAITRDIVPICRS